MPRALWIIIHKSVNCVSPDTHIVRQSVDTWWILTFEEKKIPTNHTRAHTDEENEATFDMHSHNSINTNTHCEHINQLRFFFGWFFVGMCVLCMCRKVRIENSKKCTAKQNWIKRNRNNRAEQTKQAKEAHKKQTMKTATKELAEK